MLLGVASKGELIERLKARIGGRRGFRRRVLFLSFFSILYSSLSGTALDTLLAGKVRQINGTR